MTMRFAVIGVLLALCAHAPLGAQTFYKWTDDQGVTHYTQSPPPQKHISATEQTLRQDKRADPVCCRKVRQIAGKMAVWLTRGVSVVELQRSAYDPEFGGVLEIANFVSNRYKGGLRVNEIGNLAFQRCLTGNFAACDEDSQWNPPLPPTGGTGSGFIVSRQGHILTNHHVVAGCATVQLPAMDKTARVIAQDSQADLALLRADLPNTAIARFRQDTVRLGDSIVVAGYPLRGLLGSGLNVTTGTVSALRGMNDDRRLLQITAPVQPGNSGGPLLDQSGHVVGVVVAKLNALKVAQQSGDIPQNVNFAIRGGLVQKFLRQNDITFAAATSETLLATPDISERANQFTVLVRCTPTP